MGTVEENNKELIHRQFEHYNQHELEAAWGFFAPSCFGETYTLEQQQQHDIMLFNGCPDAKYTITDMIAEGDKVSFMVYLSGTHTGGIFMGLPPTGKKIDINGTRVVRIADNKIAEMKTTVDMLTLWQQLEVLPSIMEAFQKYKETHNLE